MSGYVDDLDRTLSLFFWESGDDHRWLLCPSCSTPQLFNKATKAPKCRCCSEAPRLIERRSS